MNELRLLKLLKVHAGERLSEDNDQDVNWLVSEGYLFWNDDKQMHYLDYKGIGAIHTAVQAAKAR